VAFRQNTKGILACKGYSAEHAHFAGQINYIKGIIPQGTKTLLQRTNEKVRMKQSF